MELTFQSYNLEGKNLPYFVINTVVCFPDEEAGPHVHVLLDP